jgi:hypothetical protein
MHPNRTHLGLQLVEGNQCIVIDDHTYTWSGSIITRAYHGHYRTCKDQERGFARVKNIAWDNIVLIDYKAFSPNQHTDNDIDRVLNNNQPIKILHIACNNNAPEHNHLVSMITHLKDITWRNQLCIEYFYHLAPDPYTVEQTIEQIRAVQPRGLLQADLFIDSMDLHIPL